MPETRPHLVAVGDEDMRPAVSAAARVLVDGGLVIMPTDTVYGIAAHPGRPEAVARLCAVKQRDPDKPIAFLAAGMSDVEKKGAELGQAARRLAGAFWPGPLTMVLRTGTVSEGYRVPASCVARDLLRKAGGLLRVTSANRSGQPPALCAGDALRALGNDVDLVLDAGRAAGGTPSTVVSFEGDRICVLREGAVPAAAVLVYGES